MNKQDLEQYQRELEILGQYNQEDRVISSLEAQELAEADKKIPNINIGVMEFDDIIGGFREGQLVIISGPTGQGKTTWCQTLTSKFASKKINCLWFSYEMGIADFLEKFEGTPLFYLPKELQQNSLQWLETRIMESMAKYDCKIVFIDHLHYLLEMQKMAETHSISLLIGMMMRELKKMAIKHEITIFLVSHMRKLLYDKMPDVDDLRDSSFVGQEADIVMFIKRGKEKDSKEEAIQNNHATLRIAKNRRTGNLGVISLELINKQFRAPSEIDRYHVNTNTIPEDDGSKRENFGFGI